MGVSLHCCCAPTTTTIGHVNKQPTPTKRLQPFRPWQVLNRHLYTVDHTSPDGRPIRYTLEVDTANDDEVRVYTDGWLRSKHALPASIPVVGGYLDVDASLYGVTRMHLVTAFGAERRLTPVAGTIEDRRLQLDHRHPKVSRAIGLVAIAVLIANLALAVPIALEYATELSIISERFGTFASPFQLPTWANIALMAAGILAAMERVLTLRRNKILDAETIWTVF